MESDEDIVLRALDTAYRFFYARDVMNSEIHLEEPRLSPITKLLKEAIQSLGI